MQSELGAVPENAVPQLAGWVRWRAPCAAERNHYESAAWEVMGMLD